MQCLLSCIAQKLSSRVSIYSVCIVANAESSQITTVRPSFLTNPMINRDACLPELLASSVHSKAMALSLTRTNRDVLRGITKIGRTKAPAESLSG